MEMTLGPMTEVERMYSYTQDHASPSTTANIYAHQIAVAKAKAANVRAGVFSGRDSKPKKKRA